MGNIFIGVDPGTEGAVAAIDGSGRIVRLSNLPTFTLTSAKRLTVEKLKNTKKKTSQKRRLDGHAFARLIIELRDQAISTGGVAMVRLEQAMPMPLKGKNGAARPQGAGSTGIFMKSAGMLEGILIASSVRYQEVHPATWKKAMLNGCGGGKDASRALAKRLFPESAHEFDRKCDEHRAEAALLAEYCRRQFTGDPGLSHNESTIDTCEEEVCQ